jgi:hypothetical protein
MTASAPIRLTTRRGSTLWRLFFTALKVAL